MTKILSSPSSNALRRYTRSVFIGNVQVGSEHPIRIQSMTNSATDDIEGTVQQILDLEEAGCEIVRITVQGMKEVKACEKIKNRLEHLRCSIPLVADIHFFPTAALHVADIVDKVRINPGNYADKRYLFENTSIWSEEAFARGIEKIRDKFLPLVTKCKALGKALRIGVNHGSLSERILQRYGNTPAGLVASAIEYAQVCVEEGFHDIIFSIKSSNVIVMTESYRLLAKELDIRGWHYPLHLGVTEAGMDLEGTIKSATGIGALLLEGIGDTIRCSLTGHPIVEIPTCKEITSRLQLYQQECLRSKRYQYSELSINNTQALTDHQQAPFPLFISVDKSQVTPALLSDLGVKETVKGYRKSPTSPDAIIVADLENIPTAALHTAGIKVIQEKDIVAMHGDHPEEWSPRLSLATHRILFHPAKDAVISSTQAFLAWKKSICNHTQTLLALDYTENFSTLELAVRASIDLSSFLINNLIQGIVLHSPSHPLSLLRRIGFSILQGTRKRSTAAEMIACPSCGRTLFDLPSVTKRIHALTAHLSHLKIAVMGCIVNGPGELADADFGFIGSKPGLIDLYAKHQPVRRNIPMEEAEEALVQLLKEYRVWIEPETPS